MLPEVDVVPGLSMVDQRPNLRSDQASMCRPAAMSSATGLWVRSRRPWPLSPANWSGRRPADAHGYRHGRRLWPAAGPRSTVAGTRLGSIGTRPRQSGSHGPARAGGSVMAPEMEFGLLGPLIVRRRGIEV